MEINISEEEQRNYFINDWSNEKIQLTCEVPVFCRSVDLVKYDIAKNMIYAVEFKTKNWKRAVEQVLSTAISFDFVEICVRKPKTNKSQDVIIEYCKNLGVGLYFFNVETMKFSYVVKPKKVSQMWNVQKLQVIDLITKGDAHEKRCD